MGKYFGTDGFRGEANVELTADHAYKIGRFLGWYYSQRNSEPRIVIGKDTRRSSYMLEYALAAGITASGADAYRYPYEPTPYSVLERLAESGYIKKDNILMDYGCGKGRVGLFLHYAVGCESVGLEYDADIFQQAEENRKTAAKGQGITFYHADAAEFPVLKADTFYFFNRVE